MTNRVLRALLAGTALAVAVESGSFAQNSKFDRLDVNHDGVISRDEYEQAHPARIEAPKVVESGTTTPQEGLIIAPVTSATGDQIPALQEVIPTGSRIPRADLSFSSPVTAVTSEEVRLQGISRTEDLINSLPQAFAAQGSAINEGFNGSTSTAAGTATVNLRGLGDSRTLVLVNGRRLQPGDIFAPAPDINFVPHQLIKRVDVLTGGAGAVYGSDAVSGVVNFVLDTNFTGFRVDLQGSGFMHDNDADDAVLNAAAAAGFDPPSGHEFDGKTIDIAALGGTEFADGRGHAQAYATYRNQHGVRTGDRDYSFCALTARATRGSGTPPRDFDCAGSDVSATGTFLTNVGTFHVVGNQFVSGTTLFNDGPYDYLQRPDERYTLGGYADYEISPALRPYVEAMFMDDRTIAQTSPSGDFFNTATINCDNPLLSTQQFNTICVPNNAFVDANGVTQAIAEIGRRNIDGGPRQDDIQHTAYRIAGGLKGDPFKGVSYEAYYQYGRTLRNSTHENDFSITRLSRSLDVVANPAVGGVPGVAVGTPVCRAALLNVDLTCVPYNIFQTTGVTADALDYLQTSAFQRGVIEESIGHFDVTFRGADYGVRLPWAERGVGLNLGAEYRKQKANFRVDEQFSTGDLAGEPGPLQSFKGEYHVRDLFAELQVPIVEHGFIDLLQLSGAYRNSHYDVEGNSFNADSYGLAAELAPIPDVRARANYNRSIRAPNMFELFYPGTVGLVDGVDPCAGAVPAASFAQCANTGVLLAQYGSINANPAGQYNAVFGGNPDLTAERADSWSAGLVVAPRMIPGLALTADYFDIDLDNRINSDFAFERIMATCLTTGDPTTCALIHRAPGNASLWTSNAGFIDTTAANSGGLRTKGVDFSGAYSRPLAGGTIDISMVGTWLKDQIRDSGLESSALGQDGRFDCAKFYGNVCGVPNPAWRHKLRLGFSMANGLGISGQWRYFSSVRNDGLLDDCDVNPTVSCTNVVAPANERINAQSYFDLALTAKLLRTFDFTIGAKNIFDREPPIVGSEVANSPFGNGNTYPQVYDALGRYIFASVRASFTPPPPAAALPPPPPQIVPPPALPPPATQTCPDGSVIMATDACPMPPPPPPPPAEPERG